MIGRYGTSGELVIMGTRAELVDLAVSLGCGDDARIGLHIPANRDAKPYDGFLSTISIQLMPDTQVLISREGDVLSIVGPSAGLQTLAQNVSFLAGYGELEGSESNYIQEDYWPGHPFLSASSQPLVVGLEDESAELAT